MLYYTKTALIAIAVIIFSAKIQKDFDYSVFSIFFLEKLVDTSCMLTFFVISKVLLRHPPQNLLKHRSDHRPVCVYLCPYIKVRSERTQNPSPSDCESDAYGRASSHKGIYSKSGNQSSQKKIYYNLSICILTCDKISHL